MTEHECDFSIQGVRIRPDGGENDTLHCTGCNNVVDMGTVEIDGTKYPVPMPVAELLKSVSEERDTLEDKDD